jgi:hypothetical protein
MSNNFSVSKTEKTVTTSQIASMQQFHDLQFTLLGNELTSLFLPSCIVIVEGESDYLFIKRLVDLHYPGKGISVINSGGDGETEKQLRTVRNIFGDLSKSPYRERLFIMLDKRHSVRIGNITKQGVAKEKVIHLDANGIEYYYPEALLSEIFICGKNPYAQLQLTDNAVKVKDVEFKKTDLARLVSEQLTKSMPFAPELREKLFDPLSALVA